MVLEVILVVLGVVLRQCSEQMFGTDSVRNSVPSQLRPDEVLIRSLVPPEQDQDMKDRSRTSKSIFRTSRSSPTTSFRRTYCSSVESKA